MVKYEKRLTQGCYIVYCLFVKLSIISGSLKSKMWTEIVHSSISTLFKSRIDKTKTVNVKLVI